MKHLSRWKWYILAGIGIIIVYLATRLFALGDFPIFTDEAIYVRWAQIAKDDASWRFISLTDGKQPSFIWGAIVLLPFFNDPLVATRMVSVTTGFMTLIGLFFLGREIFKDARIGIISAFLYAIYPMAIVYDKMALYDSTVGMFMVWSFYITVLLARTLRLDAALILGLVIGGAVLTKTSGFFSIYLLPFATLLVDLEKKGLVKRLIRWILLATLASVMGFVIYNILRLSPFFHIIEEKNALFVYPLSEWIKHPVDTFLGNLAGMYDWLTSYLTYPLFVAALLAPFLSRSYMKEKLVLLIYCFAPFFALALFGNAIYPRFIFFMTLYLLPLASYTLYWVYVHVKNIFLKWGVLLAILGFPVIVSVSLLVDFENGLINPSDRNQYYSAWPSGLGVKESLDFFEKEAENGPIYIATQGTFGLMPYAYEIYTYNNPNITVKGYWPIETDIPEDILENSESMPTYVVFYQPCDVCQNIGVAPTTWPLEKVYELKKNAKETYFTVYRVRSN